MIQNEFIEAELNDSDLKYLNLLSKQYPTIDSACTEIINLKAILNLPKGTEHFLSDIHGEFEQFQHVLKNASGVIKQKIEDIFGNTLRSTEKKELATVIYYPEQKLEQIKKTESAIEDWYRITLYRLIKISKVVSSKYTRSKVRKALPEYFGYIIEELMHDYQEIGNKQEYYEGIISTIIDIGKAKDFIIALSKLIQRLAIDRLHIIGDIYDRGPGADIILDTLMDYHTVDIQWGNHDILWMGSAAGSEACIANALRISLRYANLRILEDGYGINLLPLATFAIETYVNDACTQFRPKQTVGKEYSKKEIDLLAKMHKAIAIIQFKLEEEIIRRRPQYNMEDRLILNKINFSDATITLDGIVYKLNDPDFPTIDPANPTLLTEDERELMDKLKTSFINSEKLQKHTKFLFSKGSLYLKMNGNLLYHGCIPMTPEGEFDKLHVNGRDYSGKEFIDRLERLAREGYFSNEDDDAKLYGMDCMWYLWSGPKSPLYGKKKMASFERYFINEKESHKEEKNPYFHFRDSEKICIKILEEFGLNPSESRIINGHVPVKTKEGESPIKGNGKIIVIDGGFSKAYHSKTGIAGYTLVYNSYGLALTSHEPFATTQIAIEEEKDIISQTTVLEKVVYRRRVADTDVGSSLKHHINDLLLLLDAYRQGIIKESR